MSYDLLNEPWIDCETVDGAPLSLGLRELFEGAHEIRAFHHDNPLAEAALMRILIALSHRILEGPPDKKSWKEAYERGRYDPEAITRYFERWSDRFDLFHPDYPFMQIANLHMTDSEGRSLEKLPPITLLFHHVASGNNATLFDHSIDEDPPCLKPKEAVYPLLISLFYSLGGTHKKSTDLCGHQDNCKNGIAVNGLSAYIRGDSLFETLMLNTLILRKYDSNFDRPFWEAPDTSCKETMPRGHLDYLTFSSRLVRLESCDGGVKYVHLACGRSLKEPIADPFVPMRIVKNEEKPLTGSLSRSLWRDSDTLFRYRDDHFILPALRQLASMGRRLANSSYSFVVYGLINNRGNPMGYLKEEMPIPLALLEKPILREKIKASIALTEEGHNRLRNAMKKFSDLSEIPIDVFKEKIAQNYWSSLELPFKAALKSIDKDDYFPNWHRSIQKLILESYEEGIKPFSSGKGRYLHAYVEGKKHLHLNKGGRG